MIETDAVTRPQDPAVPVFDPGAVRSMRGTTVAMLLAASIGSGIAHLGTSTMPFQVGALMGGLGLSASVAGTFGFFEIGALALTMLLVSPFIHRFSPVLVAAIGAGITVAGNVALYNAVVNVALLWILGGVAGIGYGLVFAAMVTGVASGRNPDRIYAIANGGALIVIVSLMTTLPFISSRFGAFGPFLGIAVLVLLTAPAYMGFGRPQPSGGRVESGFIRRPGVLPLLVLWTGFSLGTGALWSFAERIGHGLNLAPETVGIVLSASTFCGIAGTVVASVAAGRLSRMTSLLCGLFGCALACVTIGYATNLYVYAIGVLVYWVFYMFLYSVLLGTAAALDASGRVGTAGGGCERMGFALGATVGGLVVDHLGFGAVGLLGALGCIVPVAFLMPALRRAVA